VPIISYVYTRPIASKCFNYKHVLQNLNIDASNLCLLIAPVQVPHSYIIRLATLSRVTLKLSTTPLEVFAKWTKYRGLKSIKWKHNFKILMYSVEDYARQWAKHEKEDLDTLSEWVKSVRSLIQIRIKKISGSMSIRSKSINK
jgi:hypothetical protein